MANYNIYFSPTGGTKRVADIITDSLNGNFIDIDLCKDIDETALNANDVCVISVPSYGGRVAATALERLSKFTANGARAILNCVYGNRDYDDTLTELQDALKGLDFRCIGAIAAVAEHSIFRQFATGRPDNQDAEELRDFAIKIQQRLDENTIFDLNLPGNHDTYKDFGGSPLKPTADDNCHACCLCADECPVGAIDPDNPRATDPNRCISCMRCIKICPNSARSLNPEIFQQIEQIIAPKLSERKSNHLFL